jgi:hypothetical protein
MNTQESEYQSQNAQRRQQVIKTAVKVRLDHQTPWFTQAQPDANVRSESVG